MSDFIFRIHPNIILGSYTTSRMGQYIRAWGSKFMLVMDPVLKQVGLSDKINRSLSERNINFFTYENIPSVSDAQTLQDALNLAHEAHVDAIIATGGAKAINLGRAISALFNEKKDVYTFVDGEMPSSAPLPLALIPTTARDCFAFTERIPIADSRSSKIKLLKTQEALCKLALFDPTMMTTLTENQTTSMAMEILLMDIEAYISQKSNFFSDMLVEKSIELLSYTQEASQTVTVTTPKEALFAQAGCLASLAVATSAPGAGTLLSQCINSRFKLNRSLVAAILLPHIIEDTIKFRLSRLSHLAKISRIVPKDAEDNVAAQKLSENVRQNLAKANLPARLKELKISVEQLAFAAEDTGDLEYSASLQRSMTSDDLFDIIKLAF